MVGSRVYHSRVCLMTSGGGVGRSSLSMRRPHAQLLRLRCGAGGRAAPAPHRLRQSSFPDRRPDSLPPPCGEGGRHRRIHHRGQGRRPSRFPQAPGLTAQLPERSGAPEHGHACIGRDGSDRRLLATLAPLPYPVSVRYRASPPREQMPATPAGGPVDPQPNHAMGCSPGSGAQTPGQAERRFTRTRSGVIIAYAAFDTPPGQVLTHAP